MTGYLDYFESALGVYIGPADLSDVIDALAEHTPGYWIVRLEDDDGRLIWHHSGWSWHVVDPGDSALVFAIAVTEQVMGNPGMLVDAPLVLWFAKNLPLGGEASRYSGGLVFKPAFGDYNGRTLRLAQWHGIVHEVESGKLSPESAAST